MTNKKLYVWVASMVDLGVFWQPGLKFDLFCHLYHCMLYCLSQINIFFFFFFIYLWHVFILQTRRFRNSLKRTNNVLYILPQFNFNVTVILNEFKSLNLQNKQTLLNESKIQNNRAGEKLLLSTAVTNVLCLLLAVDGD